ncbi:hypothetical protein BGP_3545 [Beggiatoa sp. PS]|nr:hypothetical protein BGP_3545 [Beggiatoa sp. PS]
MTFYFSVSRKTSMDNEEFYQLRNFILKSGNYSVKKVQENSLKKGIPNVYSKNEMLYYELPNGEMTSKVPQVYLEEKRTKE